MQYALVLLNVDALPPGRMGGGPARNLADAADFIAFADAKIEEWRITKDRLVSGVLGKVSTQAMLDHVGSVILKRREKPEAEKSKYTVTVGPDCVDVSHSGGITDLTIVKETWDKYPDVRAMLKAFVKELNLSTDEKEAIAKGLSKYGYEHVDFF